MAAAMKRVALVTGAARGIGAAIARRLCETGRHVIVADLDLDAAGRLAAELASAEARRLDAGEPGSISALFAQLPQGWSSWTRISQWPATTTTPRARLVLSLTNRPAAARADAAALAVTPSPAAAVVPAPAVWTVPAARVTRTIEVMLAGRLLSVSGATIESQEGEKVKGSISIKFGPMSAAFAGAARLERDEIAKRAVLRGAGQDSLSKSRAQGDIAYELQAVSAENTRVNVNMVYALQGPLAQFSRSGLVKDFVSRMVTDFGKQVTRRLSGEATSPDEAKPSISIAGMMWSVLWNRVRNWFRRSPN